MKANNAAIKELKQVKGLIGAKELMDKGLTFWTLTAWEDDASMKIFRNGPAHRKAMQKLPYWCNEASYVHWIDDTTSLPDWPTASGRLLNEGKLTKVRKPSARQIAGKFPPIRWKRFENVLKSV